MKRFTIMFLILTAISYLCSDKSFAQGSEAEIQQLKQMIEQNSKQNEELMRRIQQLESDNAAKDAEFEKFISAQEAKDLKYDGIMTFFDSIDLGFAVDTTYQYVFNRGVTDSLQLRALYPDNQQFALNAFTISVSKTPTMDGGLMDLLGFRADILFGEQAAELGGEGFDSDVVDPYQAYLQVLAPIGTGLNIYAGRFVTLAGYEVIEGYKNVNISRGILFPPPVSVPTTRQGCFHSPPVLTTDGTRSKS